MMATPAQQQATREVLDALDMLNSALSKAGTEGVYIEIDDSRTVGSRNPRYHLSKAEVREHVTPATTKRRI